MLSGSAAVSQEVVIKGDTVPHAGILFTREQAAQIQWDLMKLDILERRDSLQQVEINYLKTRLEQARISTALGDSIINDLRTPSFFEGLNRAAIYGLLGFGVCEVINDNE